MVASVAAMYILLLAQFGEENSDAIAPGVFVVEERPEWRGSELYLPAHGPDGRSREWKAKRLSE